MTPSEEVRTRAQKIATLLSEEMTVRFSAYSIVHNSGIGINVGLNFYRFEFRVIVRACPLLLKRGLGHRILRNCFLRK